MENRRRILSKELKHFRGITDSDTFEVTAQGKTYLIETDENGYFDFTYDFNLSLAQQWMQDRSFTVLQIIELDTSKVTDMHEMFQYCSKMISLDLSSFDTSNVTNMGSMFNGCDVLNSVDISSFDTSSVTAMTNMFNSCSSLTSLNLSNFNTSNVQRIFRMFFTCTNLKSLTLDNFNLSHITDMSNVDKMFYRCNQLAHIKTNSAFRDWCIINATAISLPSAFKDINYKGWEIID